MTFGVCVDERRKEAKGRPRCRRGSKGKERELDKVRIRESEEERKLR